MRAAEIHMGGTGDGGFAPERIKCHRWEGDQLPCWAFRLICMSDIRLGTLTCPACQDTLMRTVNWAQLEYLLAANFLASWSQDLLCVEMSFVDKHPTKWFVTLLNPVEVFALSVQFKSSGTAFSHPGSFTRLAAIAGFCVFTNPGTVQSA